jgi:ferredoxin/flavodoxin---NADP+ reductase
MAALETQTVLDVKHWTDRLFSFRITRDRGFRFENGQFVMIGLEVDGRPLLRAYSIASANYEETMEFFSIKVPNGPLTSRLQNIQVGDQIIVGKKPTGTLVQPSLTDGKRLYLVSTGTGIAPFISVIKDPEAYERFDSIVLIHGCRFIDELAYGEESVAKVLDDEIIGEFARGKLLYYPTVTREPYRNTGRVTDLLRDGTIPAAFGFPPLDPAHDRVMICGSEAMLADMVLLMRDFGFKEGSSSEPASYVIEKAFVEK